MINVDELAGRAAAPLKGRVKRREVEETIAAAVIVGVNQVLDEAEALLDPSRVIAALSIRRHLGTATTARVVAELREVQAQLRGLRLKPCAVDAAAPPAAHSPLPAPS